VHATLHGELRTPDGWTQVRAQRQPVPALSTTLVWIIPCSERIWRVRARLSQTRAYAAHHDGSAGGREPGRISRGRVWLPQICRCVPLGDLVAASHLGLLSVLAASTPARGRGSGGCPYSTVAETEASACYRAHRFAEMGGAFTGEVPSDREQGSTDCSARIYRQPAPTTSLVALGRGVRRRVGHCIGEEIGTST